ncbi:MAG: tyrosine-type recombinase/integrase [bacterium]|nr:tyrosine-type recombinase/integrase [bacterium]
MRLYAGFVRTVKRPGRYGDGRGSHGLALVVQPRKGGGVRKSWVQRVRINERTTNLGLGAFPVVSLAEARRKALENRRAIEQGQDPRGGGIPNFRKATDRTIRLHSRGWKPGSRTESAWRNGFANHVYPRIGHMPVDRITTAHVLSVVAPLWHAKPRQAEHLKRRIGQVMQWAMAQGYRSDNPVGEALSATLPRKTRPVAHHRAIDHADVAEALRRVERSNVAASTGLAIQFIAATAARTGEARGARWSEIDFEERVWTVPAERMKTQRDHRVPLGTMSLDVLHKAARHSDPADPGALIFPGVRGGPIGHGALAAAFRRLGIGTVHGLRSSFRDWCGELGIRREVAEAALSHIVKGVEGAYARSDLLGRRREVMEAWGRYIKP